ncbi:DUF3784 domain-containing protein [Rhodocytophaga aerolata]|uniref:DUF3784 domain-containing protein n=1 Tax=Rhodocytophaga aerolata TaxID=455078 RepID=A0ABT8RE03_9BACT|nr:DUF3784 domain-containing protein [Rhodocytophaga aerolata]MDO1450336.1 DUF3784 domain-containing protein [Rhodocytophaga aerolata]
MNWILIGLGLFFITLGYLIKYAKWYWLIAGYNTASPEEKAKVDIVGLSHSMGIALFAAGVAMFLFGIGSWAGLALPVHLGITLIPILLCLYLLWTGQKYRVNPEGTDRGISIGMGLALGLPLLAILSMIAIGIFYSSKPAIISITPQQISISGIYGTTEKMENIQEVKLLTAIPPIEWKKNGFGYGDVRKGKFQLQEWGDGRLYLISDNPPFLYIKTADSYMLVNYKDSARTNQAYQSLYSNWKK